MSVFKLVVQLSGNARISSVIPTLTKGKATSLEEVGDPGPVERTAQLGSWGEMPLWVQAKDRKPGGMHFPEFRGWRHEGLEDA